MGFCHGFGLISSWRQDSELSLFLSSHFSLVDRVKSIGRSSLVFSQSAEILLFVRLDTRLTFVRVSSFPAFRPLGFSPGCVSMLYLPAAYRLPTHTDLCLW